MTKYSNKEALSELKYLESLIVTGVENLLKSKDSRAVAAVLTVFRLLPSGGEKISLILNYGKGKRALPSHQNNFRNAH